MKAPWDGSWLAAALEQLRKALGLSRPQLADGPLLAEATNTPAGAPAGKPDTTLRDTSVVHEVFAEHEVPPEEPTVTEKVTTLLVGKPLDLGDRRVYQHISLIAFLAWVGLGADGLSSSCYGPAEAFGHLGEHFHLAIFLA